MDVTAAAAQTGLPIHMPAAAIEMWLELQDAASTAGERVPCRVDPDRWWPRGGDETTADLAVDGCQGCPVFVLCRTYALAAGERYGVWGGLTPSDRKFLGAW